MKQQTLKKFLSLPLNSDETWQGGIIPAADMLGLSAMEGADEPVIALWCSAASEIVHAQPFSLSEKNIFDGLVEVMFEFSEEYQTAFRPAKIECNDQALADELSDLLQNSGTDVVYTPEMSPWDDLLRDMMKQLDMGAAAMSPLKDAGYTDEQLREFADAAASFYRAGLWDLLDDVDLIEIETPKPPRYLKYAVVLGAGSQEYGLGFYNKEKDHYGMRAGEIDPRTLNLFSLSFDPVGDVQKADIDFWNELDLPLETGDAFPTMFLFAKGKPRRATPKELDFATIVLKALADTSEEEIDSGHWTKSVEVFGKSRKCVLSIPNLLDPPDRKEWIKRGMMPERRGNEQYFNLIQEFVNNNCADMDIDEINEAINAKFTGRSMDDFECPMDTPEDRADALCQQAIDAFGRRRIQLAKQALAEDPTYVEANLLLAESTRSADRRIELFRDAMETAKQKLGSSMKEDVGHFWGVVETRPFMRACHGLATSLVDAGQVNEAIDLYQEMLRLNPNDNQGVRYEVIPLMIANNREREAVKLLDRYREPTGLWHYMNSLAVFRRDGRSADSKKAMCAAFKANPHVVELMQTDAPPFFPDSYALGSPEEAATCIHELVDAWDETEGYVQWMFAEFFIWEKETAKKLRDRKRKQRKKTTARKRR